MRNRHGGFVKLVVVLVIVLIVLGYFGFNVREIVNSPTVKGNLNYVWDLAVTVWEKVLVGPVMFIWNKVIVGMFWNNFVNLIDKAQAPPPVTGSVPTLN